MILDALLVLSDAQALTGTTAVVSANTIDLGNPTVKRDIAVGEPLALVVSMDVALVGASGTILIEAIQSASADLSTPDVVASTGVIALADAGAGQIFILPLGPNRINKRYFGARYTMAGTTPTATVTAALQPREMASLAYPRHYSKGYSI